MSVEAVATIEGNVLNYRYQVEQVFNDKGGMGLIYRATDLNLRSTVVLKKSRFVDEQSRGAFEREARLLYGLRHNALPRVIDYFITEDGSQFFVMEFIPGQDLSEMLGDRVERGIGPFAIDLVLDWGDQLLDALHYLHNHQPPIIHRDIKPQNLKLMPNGQIILLDFGLAKGAVSGMTLVNASIQGYTPNYAPLEQMRGSGTDARSDIYSLAVTMHCLLTGQMPPDAVSRAIETLSAQPDPLRPIHEINKNFPLPISEALARACSLNQNERPATALAMREVLRLARQKAAQLEANVLSEISLHPAAPPVQAELPAPAARVEPVQSVQTPSPAPMPMSPASVTPGVIAVSREAAPPAVGQPAFAPQSVVPSANAAATPATQGVTPSAAPAKSPEMAPAAAASPRQTPPSQFAAPAPNPFDTMVGDTAEPPEAQPYDTLGGAPTDEFDQPSSQAYDTVIGEQFDQTSSQPYDTIIGGTDDIKDEAAYHTLVGMPDEEEASQAYNTIVDQPVPPAVEAAASKHLPPQRAEVEARAEKAAQSKPLPVAVKPPESNRAPNPLHHALPPAKQVQREAPKPELAKPDAVQPGAGMAPPVPDPMRPTSLVVVERKDEGKPAPAQPAAPDTPIRTRIRNGLPPAPENQALVRPRSPQELQPRTAPPQRPPSQRPPTPYDQASARLRDLLMPSAEVEKPSQGDVLPNIEMTGMIANPNVAAVAPKGMRSFTEIIALNVRMEMHAIPGGEFLMGTLEKRGYADECPQHRVTLSAFYIGKYPITQAQWRAVMRTNPSHFNGNSHPVDSVTWDEAVEFCRRLSYATGRAYRLPTEAEWEFACRAGTTSLFNYGDEEEFVTQYAWCLPNASNHTHTVGEKKPNGWGLYDMHGNVWEWCYDWYSSDYYQHSPNVNPTGPNRGTSRVLRGGSWYSLPNYCRSAGRSNHQPDLRDPLVGFRVVCDAKPS